MPQSNGRAVKYGRLLAAAMLMGLAGCGGGALIGDRLPEVAGGLPAGAPARPATPYEFPAVHDMPPARDTKPLSDEDQLKLEKELLATRDRQEAVTTDEEAGEAAPPPKNPAAGSKGKQGRAKQNTGAQNGVNTGVKTNP